MVMRMTVPLALGAWLALTVTPGGTADYATEYPFPNSYLKSGSEIRYCIDRRNPNWEAHEAIAEEIAFNMGRPSEIHVAYKESDRTDGYQPAASRQEFLVMLARYCDAFMGLPGSTTAAFDYPADEEMLASRPFYTARFVLVSRDASVERLSDLGDDEPLGLHGRGVPYMLLMDTRPDSVTVARYNSSSGIISALDNGEIDHAVVYGPRFSESVPNPSDAGYTVNPVTSIPNMEWYVFAGLRSDRPTFRDEFDRAIERMLKNGRMQEILAENRMPAPTFQPAEPDAELPDDDFGDDEDEDGGGA